MTEISGSLAPELQPPLAPGASTLPNSAVLDHEDESYDAHSNTDKTIGNNSSISTHENHDAEKGPATEATEVKANPTPDRPTSVKLLIMAALCLAVFLGALDASIMTVALPTISHELNASDTAYAWIGSAYVLGNAVTAPIWAKFSDIFGRKPMLVIANAVFMIGSLICALSKDLPMLIAGRAVQGIGAGGLITLVNICVGDLFSMKDRSVAFGLVGAVWAIALVIGPVLGGVFTQEASWRWCFWISLPLDGLSLVLLIFFLKIDTPKTPLLAGLQAIDWLGAVTIVGGTLMLLFGLEFGGVSAPWDSAKVLCLIIFGIVTIGLFGIIQWKVSKQPIIPLRIFQSRSNIATLIATFCHAINIFSFTYFLPLYFQIVLGTSPLSAGIWFLPTVGPMAFLMISIGLFVRKTGRYKDAMLCGFTFMVLGFGLLISLPAYKSWPRIILFQIIMAIGLSLVFQSPLIAFQNNLAPRDLAAGTSLFAFLRQLGCAIGIVFGQVIFQSMMKKKTDFLIGAGIPENIVKSVASGSTLSETQAISNLPVQQRGIVHQALAETFRDMWIFYTCLSVVGFLASLGVQKKELSSRREETKLGLETEKTKD